jgi:transposase
MRKPLPMLLSIDEHYFPESDMDSLYCCLLMNFITGEVKDVLPSRRKHYLIDYFSSIRGDI